MIKPVIKFEYEYADLSPEAQDRALEVFRESTMEFLPWFENWVDTFKAFIRYFDVSCSNWSIDPFGQCDFKIKYDGSEYELKGVRLWKWLQKNYPLPKDCGLTGFCGDEDILKPMRDFYSRPTKDTTLEDLIEDCLDSFVTAMQKDMEYQISDECLIESIQINEYKFDKQGKML